MLWSGHSGRLAEPPADGPTHRRACGCPARAGSRVHPAALPSRPPRLRRHSGLFQENDGSHGSGRWHPMHAPVFRLFIHILICALCAVKFTCLPLLYAWGRQEWPGPGGPVTRTWHVATCHLTQSGTAACNRYL